MKPHNAVNERIKREYFAYLRHAQRSGDQTVDGVAKALNRFEVFTRFRDFKLFHIDQAVAFKRYLAEQLNRRSGERLSKATLHSTLTALKRFFHWLAGKPGYKSHLSYSDSDYFNLSEKDTQIAKARREQPVPTIEQIRHVIETMSTDTAVELRDRALIAFTLLTGSRDGAIASFKLKHVDLTAGRIFQDARQVNTKFSKTFTTDFFPIGDELRQTFLDWISHLQSEMLWGFDDPLFPATRVATGDNLLFEQAGLDRKHWADAGPIRAIFKRSFENAGLPYFNPPASGRPWSGSAWSVAAPRRNSRLGAKTWATIRS